MSIKLAKTKFSGRDRTRMRIRKKVSGTEERPRLNIYRSTQHTYGQIICDLTGKTLVSASTLEDEVKKLAKELPKAEGAHSDARSTKSAAAARAVGHVLAKRCQAKKISSAVFDRNGFIYTGRVKALADGAREAGLEF